MKIDWRNLLLPSHKSSEKETRWPFRWLPGIEGKSAGEARTPTTFKSLKHRNYRLFWTGQIISLTGTWMQLTALGWLVYNITDSALSLGILGFARFFPVWLFSLLGGVVADRLPKQKILLVTQSTATILALALAILTVTELIEFWHVLVISFGVGAILAFDAPTRQAFVTEMVGKEDLTNAIALNSMAFNLARIMGPAIAGVIVVTIGEAGCFFINVLTYSGPITSLLLMRVSELHQTKNDEQKESVWENLRAGVQYVRSKRTILTILFLTAASSMFAISYASLMPIFARDVLKVGATGNGILFAAAGVGALLGALFMATMAGRIRKGSLFTFGNFLLPIGLIAFSFSRSLALSLVLLACAGFGAILQNASANSLLQTISDDRYRGRVMSLFTLVFLGMFPFGDMFEGTAAEFLGAPVAIAIGAVICIVFAVWAFWVRPEIRKHA